MITISTVEGQDADGNRGMLVDEYILEPSDRDEIIRQLIEVHGKEFTIEMTNSRTQEEVEIEINLEEWL